MSTHKMHDFAWALREMRNEFRVCRLCWPTASRWLAIRSGGTRAPDSIPFIILGPSREDDPWIPDPEDLVAKDWVRFIDLREAPFVELIENYGCGPRDMFCGHVIVRVGLSDVQLTREMRRLERDIWMMNNRHFGRDVNRHDCPVVIPQETPALDEDSS